MELSTNTVLYETRNQIAYITLNRPESLNALSRELGVGLDEAMDEFRDDPDLLVAILIGSGGRAFSAGMDLKERAYQIGLIQHQSSRTGRVFSPRGVFKPIIERSTATASPEDWSCR